MIWMRMSFYEYQPMAQEDAALFCDIPLVIYTKTRKRNGHKFMTISLIGLHRKETVSVTIPEWNRTDIYGVYLDRQEKIIQKACMQKWPLKDPFAYGCCDVYPDVKVPDKLGHVIPDWKAVSEAAKVAVRMDMDDKDGLFISLYNEIIRSNINEFKIKHKKEPYTATGKALAIKDIPEEVKEFIMHVSDVMIERETGNNKKNTFDFIRIRMSVPAESTFSGRKEFINRNMKWFMAVALNRLNDLKRFTRFGVPVTCLSLKKATLTHTNELELLFELKDELKSI